MTPNARKFWTLVSFNLTIVARPDLLVGTCAEEISTSAHVGYNELQHSIIGLLATDPPSNGSWMIAVLFEQASKYHLEGSLSWAIESAADVMTQT